MGPDFLPEGRALSRWACRDGPEPYEGVKGGRVYVQKQATPSNDLPWGGKEQWHPGERAHFEYHCNEAHNSGDAQAWYRSHRAVTVLVEDTDPDYSPRGEFPTHAQRAEAGMPVTYKIRHDDGHEHTAFEDELLRGPEHFERPDPPAPVCPTCFEAAKTRNNGGAGAGHGHEPDWHTSKQAHVLTDWQPTERLFAPTKGGVDPRLFDADREMLPGVRSEILDLIDAFWQPKYGDWRSWARCYLAGSQASEWYGNNDFDLLLGVDYDGFRKATGQTGSNEEITRHLNREFQTSFNDENWHPKFDPEHEWHRTGYVNKDSYDIRAIKPYAAYDVGANDWAVEPIHEPTGHQFSPSEWYYMEGFAEQIKTAMTLPEPARTQYLKRIWHFLHADRSRAFGPHGTGAFDRGNATEKYLDQAGLWEPLMQAQYSKTAAVSWDSSHDDLCTACGGSGEQGTGHECYICDGTGDGAEERHGRSRGVTNDNPGNGLLVGLDLARGQRPKTAAIKLKCSGCGEDYFTDGEKHGCDDPGLHDHWTEAKTASSDHETLYHLTDQHHFAPDAEKAPQDNAFAIQDRSHYRGLYVTDSPDTWRANGYHRPYVAEIHVPHGLAQQERWHGEKFIPAEHFDKIKVNRVIPFDAHQREEWGEHGTVESYHGTHYQTDEPINTKTEHGGYAKVSKEPEAKDVRDFTPEEHTRHLHRLREYLHDVQGYGWNEFNDKHEHVGIDSDDVDRDNMPIRRDQQGKAMTRERYAHRTTAGASGPDYNNLLFTKHRIKSMQPDEVEHVDALPWHAERGESFSAEHTYAGDDDHVLFAHHPDHGIIGQIRYAENRVPSPGKPYLNVASMAVSPQHERRGVASQMQDALANKYPGWRIDHGTRTDDGQAWAQSYFDGTEPDHGRREARVHYPAEGPDGETADGIMIALVPPKRVITNLPLPLDGEHPSNVHITLVYLGKVADFTPEQVEYLPELVEAWAETQKPLDATVQGVGTFTNPGSHVLWAAADIPGGNHLWVSLADTLKGHGYAFKENHGWTPHLTMSYEKHHVRFLPKVPRMEFKVREVWCCIGGRWESFRLQGK